MHEYYYGRKLEGFHAFRVRPLLGWKGENAQYQSLMPKYRRKNGLFIIEGSVKSKKMLIN